MRTRRGGDGRRWASVWLAAIVLGAASAAVPLRLLAWIASSVPLILVSVASLWLHVG